MADLKVSNSCLRDGIWEGHLSGTETAPAVQLLCNGQVAGSVSVLPHPDGGFSLSAPLPAASNGVQTFAMVDTGNGASLAHLTLVAGSDFPDDLRAEVALLRSEVELLKRILRNQFNGGPL
jgi:hypothetical protein